MNDEAVLLIHGISLVFVILAMMGVVYLIRIGKIDWKLLALPLLLIVNLGLFYVVQIITSVTGSEMPSYARAWAILLRFQLALTAAVAIGLAIINGKVNGHYE